MKYYEKNGITIYHCDNSKLLRKIESESVNLIYSDILYNTGKRFNDYDDNLGAPQEAMEWYRPRLEEMKRVLASNGSIFLHCNRRLDSYLRILMDEIFGGECFRNRIYRKHSQERGFYQNFDSQIDIILYYVKDRDNFVFRQEQNLAPMLIPLYENGFVEARSHSLSYHGELIDLASQNFHWMITEAQFRAMDEKNEIRIIDGLPYRYTTVKPIGNLWDESNMLDTYKRTAIADAYDTPKPEAILYRIINTCSNPGDLVADFFLGGGTTAVVTQKLKRRGIFCDISEKACFTTVSKLESLTHS